MRPSKLLICILLSFFLHFGFANGHSSNCTVASTTVYLNRQNAVVAVPFDGFTEKNTQFNTSDVTCFTSFLGSPCNSSCPKNASTVLRITSSRGCKEFQNISALNKFGLVSIISADDFSITFVCPRGICPCPVIKGLKKDHLSIVHGTYKQYLQMEGPLRRAMKSVHRPQKAEHLKAKVANSTTPTTMSSKGRATITPTVTASTPTTTAPPLPEHPLQIFFYRKKLADNSNPSTTSDTCYCGTTVIGINKNRNNSTFIRTESCVKGKDDFDPSPQKGSCYITYEQKDCDYYLLPCYGEIVTYLFVYYNRLHSNVTTPFEANPNISGYATLDYSKFNITLSCMGSKCEPEWNITKDKIDVQSGNFGFYRLATQVLAAAESDLKQKPEAENSVPLAKTNECHCGHGLFEISYDFQNVNSVQTRGCEIGEDGYSSKPLQDRCYVTYTFRSCDDAKEKCNVNFLFIAEVFFNQMNYYNSSLEKYTNFDVGFINSFISPVEFSITLTCQGDRCFPKQDIITIPIPPESNIMIPLTSLIREQLATNMKNLIPIVDGNRPLAITTTRTTTTRTNSVTTTTATNNNGGTAVQPRHGPYSPNANQHKGVPDAHDPGATTDDETEEAGLSGGAIAGIVLGVLAVLAVAALLLYFFVFRKKKNKKAEFTAIPTENPTSNPVENPTEIITPDGQTVIVPQAPPGRQAIRVLPWPPVEDISHFKCRGVLKITSHFRGEMRHELEGEISFPLEDIYFDHDLDEYVIIGSDVEIITSGTETDSDPASCKDKAPRPSNQQGQTGGAAVANQANAPGPSNQQVQAGSAAVANEASTQGSSKKQGQAGGAAVVNEADTQESSLDQSNRGDHGVQNDAVVVRNEVNSGQPEKRQEHGDEKAPNAKEPSQARPEPSQTRVENPTGEAPNIEHSQANGQLLENEILWNIAEFSAREPSSAYSTSRAKQKNKPSEEEKVSRERGNSKDNGQRSAHGRSQSRAENPTGEPSSTTKSKQKNKSSDVEKPRRKRERSKDNGQRSAHGQNRSRVENPNREPSPAPSASKTKQNNKNSEGEKTRRKEQNSKGNGQRSAHGQNRSRVENPTREPSPAPSASKAKQDKKHSQQKKGHVKEDRSKGYKK